MTDRCLDCGAERRSGWRYCTDCLHKRFEIMATDSAKGILSGLGSGLLTFIVIALMVMVVMEIFK